METILTDQEKSPVRLKTITAQEMRERIYKDESLPQDKRFVSIKEGGVFKYFDLENIIGIHTDEEDKFYYPLVEVDNEVVGLAELENDPRKEGNFWMKFVSVDPKFQNMGYARKIIEEIFRFVSKKGFSLEMSYYTPEGKKLRKIFDEYSKKFSVKLINNIENSY